MIPEKFTERMKKLLGEEYAEFEAALGEAPVRAIRVNETKIGISEFLEKTSLELEPLSYAPDGFIPRCTDGIGNTPEHHAGMFYVQDPGAMATVNSLDIQKGWWVLDTCAAPGGKSSQLSSRIGDGGFLLANEYVPKRAKIIVGNLERLGIKNAMVTSLDTAELGKSFSSVFDLVLCDAPCSGEGMFRKYDEALTEWSEENVLTCARRQYEILTNISDTVKPGGYLLYSTCTYSVEENEGVISRFLNEHPGYTLSPVKEAVVSVTRPGIDVGDGHDYSLTRRFYPHVSRGEGQFIALLKRCENSGNKSTILYKDSTKQPSKDEISAVEGFFRDNMSSRPSGRLIKQGDGIALIAHGCPVPPYSVFMPGVMLGEVKRGNFFPHHHLFSAYGKDMKRKESLSRTDERVIKYLRGEEIEERDSAEGGFLSVLYEGVPLGGGKASAGMIKNHYPKGLRNK